MYIQRAVIWGAVVVAVFIPLLVLTCMWYYCTAYLCKRSKGDGIMYKVAKILCGAMLILLVLVTL